MTIIEHIEIEMTRLKSEVSIGKGNNRGHLPGQVLFSLERKLKALKTAFDIISKAYNQ
jgi:hypothetical protein